MDSDKSERPDAAEDSATGYLYTHFDCPNCGHDDQREGDCTGETIECADCGHRFTIERVA